MVRDECSIGTIFARGYRMAGGKMPFSIPLPDEGGRINRIGETFRISDFLFLFAHVFLFEGTPLFLLVRRNVSTKGTRIKRG